MMKSCSDLMRMIKSAEGMTRMVQLYGSREGEVARQMERYMLLLKRHEDLFGTEKMPLLVSAPGRTELCGNHTDHNNGRVLAAAVNLDTVAAVSPRDDLQITLHSEGFAPIRVDLNNLSPVKEEQGTPASIIRGIAARMQEMGCMVRGFDGTATSNVLSGSGLSSSAAFEVLICAIFDALYNGMKVDPIERAKIAQYAENVYFGKPCGLMDQMASSLGGLVFLDFADPAQPIAEAVEFSFAEHEYTLCTVDSGADHAGLTADYAAIPQEMHAVAACFGKDVLREVDEQAFYCELPRLRRAAGDRAVLRAMHFFDEDQRVRRQVQALREGQLQAFLDGVNASGDASWELLQNITPPGAVEHQSMALTLALCRRLLGGAGAVRVHGGGFAGTVLAFVPDDRMEAFSAGIAQTLGPNACCPLQIQSDG